MNLEDENWHLILLYDLWVILHEIYLILVEFQIKGKEK